MTGWVVMVSMARHNADEDIRKEFGENWKFWRMWDKVIEAETAEAACEKLATGQRWPDDMLLTAVPFDQMPQFWVKPETLYRAGKTGNIVSIQ